MIDDNLSVRNPIAMFLIAIRDFSSVAVAISCNQLQSVATNQLQSLAGAWLKLFTIKSVSIISVFPDGLGICCS